MLNDKPSRWSLRRERSSLLRYSFYLSLVLTLLAVACARAPQDNLIGEWVSPKSKDNSSMKITRNGDAYLVEVATGAAKPQKIPATYQNGVLRLETGVNLFGAPTVFYDEKTDRLICNLLGKQDELVRK